MYYCINTSMVVNFFFWSVFVKIMSEIITGVSRKRARNFSREEQMLLCSVMEPYIHIVENKKTDDIKQHVKQSTWHKITEFYNANTKSVPRTTENLLACYRNMKSKIKKHHSESKMCIKDSNAKEKLLSAIEEHDKDWEAVAEQLNTPILQCKEDFEKMKKEFQKQESKHKKAVLGTGGGPPPSDDEMEPLIKIKKLLEPQIDGLFTLYDGDAKLMTKYQENLPEKERVKPIEHLSNLNFDTTELSCNRGENNVIIEEIEVHQPPRSEIMNNESLTIEIGDTPIIKNKFINRQSILKKRKSSALTDAAQSHPTINKLNSIQNLADEKLELVKIQKKLVQMEMEHKKNLFAMELEEMKREHEFKEEKRQKEMILLDLKIKKFSDY